MKRLLPLLLFLLAAPAHAGIVLESTDALEIITATTADIDYDCSFTDNTTTAFTPGKVAGQITTATTTSIVAGVASTQRNIIDCTFRNIDASTANTLTVQRDVSATNRTKLTATVLAGESLVYTQADGWRVLSAAGIVKTRASDVAFDGRTVNFYKLGTTHEAAGIRYFYGKDTGFPGAWVPGAPGLNGAATDCSSTAGAGTMGAPYLVDPTQGAMYLTYGGASLTTAHYIELIDVLWYNTNIVVTTTTAQNITFPGLPSRDQDGTANGADVQLALYVQAATTNAGAVTTITCSYTDQDGNAGATGTIATFPATATAGVFVPFQLAAGDVGMRSVQSLTLGTSLVTGTVHLVAYRLVGSLPIMAANLGGAMQGMVPTPASPGVRIYNDSCLWIGYIGSTTTGTNLGATFSIMAR